MDGEAIAIGYFGTVKRGLRVVGGGAKVLHSCYHIAISINIRRRKISSISSINKVYIAIPCCGTCFVARGDFQPNLFIVTPQDNA